MTIDGSNEASGLSELDAQQARDRDSGDTPRGGRSFEDNIVNKISSSQNPGSPFSQDGLKDNNSFASLPSGSSVRK